MMEADQPDFDFGEGIPLYFSDFIGRKMLAFFSVSNISCHPWIWVWMEDAYENDVSKKICGIARITQ